ncbi:hypothetical protein VAEKB19_5650005 [Vibrio aestuarianus]|nr:hypothetical protein VAEKB19_5650005 [Vibrio aestuarianus]
MPKNGKQSAKPILDELYEWMTTQKVLESSPLGKAIKYTLGQWPKLSRYIDDGHLSIDNNRAERAINRWSLAKKIGSSRPILVGLKRVRCFTGSLRQLKPTVASSTTIWLSA